MRANICTWVGAVAGICILGVTGCFNGSLDWSHLTSSSSSVVFRVSGNQIVPSGVTLVSVAVIGGGGGGGGGASLTALSGGKGGDGGYVQGVFSVSPSDVLAVTVGVGGAGGSGGAGCDAQTGYAGGASAVSNSSNWVASATGG